MTGCYARGRAGRFGRALLPLAVAAGLCGAAGGARAGLFDDDEARKAILDLRARIQASDDASKARSAELAASQAQALEQLRRSLVELNTLIEAQRAELARLRGVQEQMQRDVAELQKQQRERVGVVEERLRKLEPQQVSVDGKEFMVEPDERRMYDEAVNVLRGGDFDKSAVALAAFIRRYPASGYLDSARFWLGNALYGKRDYKEAIAVFRAMISSSPDHPRAAEALLAVANCQVEMKDVRGARRTLDDLLKSYPKSEAAAAGRERLGSLKG
ncbi:tol-pal system protein YbgF [Aquabacterium humicola]|uniref:tol-pal system protein YbgF n=1 Tax=Aquabacterium humicola TaxID=3237377 RepID=UPI002543A554|nr:tol-pal system protein YbgF [Rubrivivax pictus]